MASSPTITEGDILEDIVSSTQAGLTPHVARIFLELKFNKNATKRLPQLLQKTNRGTITAKERLTLERYLRVGQFLDLLQAKAKLSLQEASDSHEPMAKSSYGSRGRFLYSTRTTVSWYLPGGQLPDGPRSQT